MKMNNISKDISKSEINNIKRKIFKYYSSQRKTLKEQKEKKENEVRDIDAALFSMADHSKFDADRLALLVIKKSGINKEILELEELLRREGKPLEVHHFLSKIR